MQSFQFETKKRPFGAFFCLFLSFFMRCFLLAPLAELFEFDLALDGLAVLDRPVVGPFALGTVEFYEVILRHVIDFVMSEDTNVFSDLGQVIRTFWKHTRQRAP